MTTLGRHTDLDKLRAVRFPGYTLHLYYLGGEKLGYRLLWRGKVLFEGRDFRPSPMHSVDSDQAVAGLMGFLTLKPGDTDREYFEGYTPEQLAWAQSMEPELLELDVINRFGEV